MVWQIDYPHIKRVMGSTVVAIGNFDGVHAGHQSLLAVAKAEARARDLPLLVLTFEPHPRAVLRPEVPLRRLTGLDEKVELLGQAGVDGVAVMAFDMDLAGWSPERFVDDALVGWLEAKCVCVGENFRFGKKAAGDVAMLAADGRFDVKAAVLLVDAGGIVSSSRLRREGV